MSAEFVSANLSAYRLAPVTLVNAVPKSPIKARRDAVSEVDDQMETARPPESQEVGRVVDTKA